MKATTLTTAAITIVLASSAAFGGVHTYSTNDLQSLDHNWAYTWGLTKLWAANEQVVEATLLFKSLRENYGDDEMFVRLLPSASAGVSSVNDGNSNGDYFNGIGMLLEHYQNYGSTPTDASHTFTAAELSGLNTYAADGNFGIGLDPDCHYYNCGVELAVRTEIIPEPTTISLLGLSTVGVLLRRRRRNR